MEESMVQITAVSGQAIEVPDDAVSLVAGPYPHDVGPHTYVYGPAAGAIVTSETPQLLIARLTDPASFVVFRRPNGTPVWVRAAAVSLIRAPLRTEIPSSNDIVSAVIRVSGFHQAVQEDVVTAEQIIARHVKSKIAMSASDAAASIPQRSQKSARSRKT
jgi:hypothetical protein